ncbi:hypothetical protein RB2150_17832 [Rhodobacterales bacterium HTCC2150]|nr:hypothetical protein RB2150_17832 [Rhodobacterales bacterium HTCC2150] [Rhodobacteraceae bacterium HTCC2150]
MDHAHIANASERVGKHLDRAFTPSKKRLSLPQSQPIFARYLKSKTSLRDFCSEEGLDPKTFLKGLSQWRKYNRGAK